MSDVCLYRCWTENVNGKPSKFQSCYPHESGFTGMKDEDIGKTVIEPLRSATGKFEKFQAIKCKYPDCI